MGAVTTKPITATRYPGVGPRAAATVLDWGILFIVILGVALVIAAVTAATNNLASPDAKGGSLWHAFVIWAVLALLYYVVFEATLGATPGKLLVGLCVRNSAGEKITWKAALIRNLMRVVDAFPYVIPYLTGAIAIWNDDTLEQVADDERRRRRIGDRVAGTVVIYR